MPRLKATSGRGAISPARLPADPAYLFRLERDSPRDWCRGAELPEPELNLIPPAEGELIRAGSLRGFEKVRCPPELLEARGSSILGTFTDLTDEPPPSLPLREGNENLGVDRSPPLLWPTRLGLSPPLLRGVKLGCEGSVIFGCDGIDTLGCDDETFGSEICAPADRAGLSPEPRSPLLLLLAFPERTLLKLVPRLVGA